MKSQHKELDEEKITWFNPPFGRMVKTNIGRYFLSLIGKYFPTTNNLHKIFNRNAMKVSHSRIGNMKSVINRYNTGIPSRKMGCNA